MKQKNLRSQPKNKTAAVKPTVNRFWLIIAVFALWATGIGARLVYLQTAQKGFLSDKAAAQRRREHKTKPLRGSIFDRSGRELAITLESESLWTDPTELENAEATAYQIASLIGKKPKELLSELHLAKENKRRFIWLGRELEDVTIGKIKSLNIAGLHFRKEQKRSYPNGSLASHVVGYANRDDVGQAGIERTQNQHLRGEYTEITEERDGSGRVLERVENVVQSPRSVILTIDSAIQFRAEQALAAGLEAAGAKAGAAVVLNPQNGDILAMATAPAFDPHNVGDARPELLSNRAVQNTYEPGSTFKLISYSAAIEETGVNPNDEIDCGNGSIKIGSRTIRDTGKAGKMTITDALARSSNVAAITLGQKVGKDKLYEYMRKFGYGAETGVELPAESRGKLHAPEKWSADSIGSVPIGYEVSVTTLQSAAAFGAIANDGVRVAPHLIKEIREENGFVLPANAPESRRVVSVETARKMRGMLAAVTQKGTAQLAQLAGYTTAGKTGTAHKFDSEIKGYSKNKIIASFVGFAPIENPAVVIAVMVDEPRGVNRHGGDVAAPIFRDIAEQVLPKMHVAPDNSSRASENLIAQKIEPAPSPKITETKLKTEKVKPSSDEKDIVKNVERSPGKDKLEKKETKDVAAKNKSPEKPKINEPRERIIEPKKPKDTAKPPNLKTKAEKTAKPEKTKGKT